MSYMCYPPCSGFVCWLEGGEERSALASDALAPRFPVSDNIRVPCAQGRVSQRRNQRLGVGEFGEEEEGVGVGVGEKGQSCRWWYAVIRDMLVDRPLVLPAARPA